jgi:hypothetical protein
MYGLTRGAITLIGVIVAGFLIWLGVEPLGGESTSEEEYWWAVLMCALAGLAIALSQLLGGWTKWGWPRLSLNVFLLGFVPALIAGGWALLYAQPEGGTMRGDIRSWSEDLGIDGLMGDLSLATLAIAFALGLIFGLTFDTTGPMARRRRGADETPAPATPVRPGPAADEDERRVRIREGETEGETRSE